MDYSETKFGIWMAVLSRKIQKLRNEKALENFQNQYHIEGNVQQLSTHETGLG